MSVFDFGVGLGDSNYLFDNFNDQGFVATNGDILAITFTGTFSLSGQNSGFADYAALVADWTTNGLDGGLGWEGILANYDGLINSALNYALNNNITQLLVAGHSRGGALAELYYVNNSEALSGFGFDLHAVTFASPGVLVETDHVWEGMLKFEDPEDLVVDLVANSNSQFDAEIYGGADGISSHALTSYDTGVQAYVQRWLDAESDGGIGGEPGVTGGGPGIADSIDGLGGAGGAGDSGVQDGDRGFDVYSLGWHYGWTLGWYNDGWVQGWHVGLHSGWHVGWHVGWYQSGGGWAYGWNMGWTVGWTYGWTYGWHNDGWEYGWNTGWYYGWGIAN